MPTKIFSTFHSILSVLTKRQKFALVALLMLIVVSSILETLSLGLVLPYMSMVFNSEGVSDQQLRYFKFVKTGNTTEDFIKITVFYIIVILSAAAIRVLMLWTQLKVSHGIVFVIQERLFLNSLNRKFDTRTDTSVNSDINLICKQAEKVSTEFIVPLINILAACTLILGMGGFIAYVNPTVAIIAIASFATVYLFVGILTRYRINRYGMSLLNDEESLISTVSEANHSIRDVIISNLSSAYQRIFNERNSLLKKSQVGNLLIGLVPRYIIESLAIISIVLFCAFSKGYSKDILSLLPLLILLVVSMQKLLPLMQLAFVNYTQIKSSATILRVIARELLINPKKERKCSPVPFKRKIELDEVVYNFGSKQVLSNVSIRINFGDIIALTGHSGAGKSTLIEIIMGLRAPNAGSLLVDGLRVTESNVGEWQDNIAYVPQSVFLVDDTVKANVAFGVDRRNVDERRVIESLKIAKIYDYVDNLPNKIDFVVGENGGRLSGGQRQRIGIARALYKGSKVLVLDEATSALDEITQEMLIKSLVQYPSDLTILLVTHRDTTIKFCNRIWKLHNGKISELHQD